MSTRQAAQALREARMAIALLRSAIRQHEVATRRRRRSRVDVELYATLPEGAVPVTAK